MLCGGPGFIQPHRIPSTKAADAQGLWKPGFIFFSCCDKCKQASLKCDHTKDLHQLLGHFQDVTGREKNVQGPKGDWNGWAVLGEWLRAWAVRWDLLELEENM